MANWFIALPVSAEAWFAALAPFPDVVRPFHPDDLHATALGACGEARARRAFAALRTTPIPVRRVTLTEIVPMGPPRKWSALAEVVDAKDERPALSDLLVGPRDRSLTAAEVRLKSGGCVPVTIGRVTRKSGSAGRKSGLQWAQSIGRIERR